MNRLKKLISEQEISHNFVVFYAVGLVLFFLPWTRELFIAITPFTLLLVFGAAFYHHKLWDYKTVVIFSIIIVSSYFFEVAGVNSGLIFGQYEYSKGLGLQIFNTPLIIGLNWLFLVYATHSIVYQFTKNSFLRIISGAFLMVFYDFIIEFIAPEMHMWSFENGYPPLQNFTSWLGAALVFHALTVFTGLKIANKPARNLFYIQLAFFSILTVFKFLFLK